MTDYNSLEEAFNRLALMTERDALAQQLAVEKVKNQTLMIELQDKNGVLVDIREQLVVSQEKVGMQHDDLNRYSHELAARDKRIAEAVWIFETLKLNGAMLGTFGVCVDEFLSPAEEKAIICECGPLRNITEGGHFPACTRCHRRLKP